MQTVEIQKTNTLKQASLETIRRLPDNCSVDDIMYEINFVAKVYEGLKDADEGKLITTEELLRKIETGAMAMTALAQKSRNDKELICREIQN